MRVLCKCSRSLTALCIINSTLFIAKFLHFSVLLQSQCIYTNKLFCLVGIKAGCAQGGVCQVERTDGIFSYNAWLFDFLRKLKKIMLFFTGSYRQVWKISTSEQIFRKRKHTRGGRIS